MRVLALLLPLFAVGSSLRTQVPACNPLQPNCSAPRLVRGRVADDCVPDCDDWDQFSDAPHMTSFSTANVHRAELRWRFKTPETVEGSPIFIQGAPTQMGPRNLVIVSTLNGRLIALDASRGTEIWSTDPPEGPRWTTSSPALDPNRLYVYGYCLDGFVHRYLVSNGSEAVGDGWPELITLKGDVEKGSSALSIATAASGENFLYMTIAAYPEPGDDGDYQGHLVSVNLDTGTQHIFNAACSDKEMHFVENGDASTDCPALQAGIWARSGAVYDRRTDRLYITTGNGVFDAQRGGYNWASSVVALRPDGGTDRGTPLDSYTPSNFQELNDHDLDLSSTTVLPLQLPDGSDLPPLAVQGGKDGVLRLLDLSDLSGSGGPRHVGGELQLLSLPQRGYILTRPVSWLDKDRTYLAVSNHEGISVLVLNTDSGAPRLSPVWTASDWCTSPIYANGLLFCARSGVLTARVATTGEVLWTDTNVDSIHWQSPIAVGNNLYLADATGVNAYTVQ